MNPSPADILLPSTIGIPPRNSHLESHLRDPRILWAPSISISGKNDQPFITPQYQKKQQYITEQVQQVRFNSKIATNGEYSHLTRMGSVKTRLPISFLPHNTITSKKSFPMPLTSTDI